MLISWPPYQYDKKYINSHYKILLQDILYLCSLICVYTFQPVSQSIHGVLFTSASELVAFLLLTNTYFTLKVDQSVVKPCNMNIEQCYILSYYKQGHTSIGRTTTCATYCIIV